MCHLNILSGYCTWLSLVGRLVEAEVMKIELTKQELNLIIIGMTGCMYSLNLQKEAFELVMKLRDKLLEAT
jgi:hypothetical protein